MTFKWEHKCSLDWMKERQKYLTASDMKKIIPVTATGKDRVIKTEDYFKVFSSKNVSLTEDDCYSYGAMARGHILEPYAIEAYNKYTSSHLYHWDDILLANDIYQIAFSPDGCNISYEDYLNGAKISQIIEVKCYGHEKHMTKLIEDRMNMEERWQIATAMVVCPSITLAHLVFFDPSSSYEMIEILYSRKDLLTEINKIIDAAAEYYNVVKDPYRIVNNLYHLHPVNHEQEIIEELKEKAKLNP